MRAIYIISEMAAAIIAMINAYNSRLDVTAIALLVAIYLRVSRPETRFNIYNWLWPDGFVGGENRKRGSK